ncbi:alpha/beta hydrolase [Trichloromonas sp.]|uniref:alpha/beta hydrolase n=1 Tax=Trichloromonas sp. TaxID=3069249 RepID=UPI003D8136C7
MGFRQKRSLILLLMLGGLAFAPGSESAMEHRFIFFPERPLVATPALYDLAYEEVHFPAGDGTALHGWYLPGEPGKPLVLFCHGNAGNISHRLDNLRLLHRLGVSVFIFDYRGYGKSAGKASEEGTYSDARGARAWLQARGWPPERIVYFGRSLGASVALQLAVEHPPAGLVLETPFTSIAAMGRHHNPILYFALGWLLDARYDNLAKIVNIRTPLLIFQGDRDNIVPESMARNLFEAANEPKTWHLIPGADHNDTYDSGGEDYWSAWSTFLRKLAPAQ